LPDKPFIVLLFYAHIYPTDTSACVAAIAERLSRIGNVVPIGISGVFAENQKALRAMVLEQLPKKPDALINLMSFRLGAGPMGGDAQAGVDFLREVDAPYLHPFFIARRTQADWEASVQGCTVSETMISVMLPELDGCIETLPIGAMGAPRHDARYDVSLEALQIIDERLDRLVQKVERLVELRGKANAHKRVAIICYNYPPGEANLFGGAFLDTFASVAAIAARLRAEGYTVPEITRETLTASFRAGGAVNSGQYGGLWEEMIRYPAGVYTPDPEVREAWGAAPGTTMADGNDFLIPGIVAGNVFIGLQPARGTEDEDHAYHDKTLPPHHQYVAFYQWLDREFHADAIIHVGTHGTLEFLKGKECGMSGDCYPDRLLSDIPHMYLYYAGNPSEATIAKRRSRANLVGYQPPIFTQSELYGEYAVLATEMDHYRQALSLSPQSAEEILSHIRQSAAALHLPEDLEALEKELYRLHTSLIPKGLHVFGIGYTEAEGLEYARGLVRYPRNGNPSL
ncbi:MAG TPA: cobaltochelatase subunit CobN, partial [Clostridia bacterium]|nr:cobaltochelatase subunit CobN [Clostridia bacterium]